MKKCQNNQLKFTNVEVTLNLLGAIHALGRL